MKENDSDSDAFNESKKNKNTETLTELGETEKPLSGSSVSKLLKPKPKTKVEKEINDKLKNKAEEVEELVKIVSDDEKSVFSVEGNFFPEKKKQEINNISLEYDSINQDVVSQYISNNLDHQDKKEKKISIHYVRLAVILIIIAIVVFAIFYIFFSEYIIIWNEEAHHKTTNKISKPFIEMVRNAHMKDDYFFYSGIVGIVFSVICLSVFFLPRVVVFFSK